MVFGWTQIVMDVQPLIVMISGEGHLHGFTHTYLGAVLIAIVSALSGKYLSEIGLRFLGNVASSPVKIGWWVSFSSALIGSFSHVLLDSIVHADVEPYYPITSHNEHYNLLSFVAVHKLCLYAALAGAAIYYLMHWRSSKP